MSVFPVLKEKKYLTPNCTEKNTKYYLENIKLMFCSFVFLHSYIYNNTWLLDTDIPTYFTFK